MSKVRTNGMLKNKARNMCNPQYQSVQIIVDPKTCNLDKTMRDIIQISDLVIAQMPSVRIESVTVNDYFATVNVYMRSKSGASHATLRLYETNNTWKIRGCAINSSQPYFWKP